MAEDKPQFDAFISYRRIDGALLARRLRRELLDYRLPPELTEGRPQKNLSIYIDRIYERADESFFEDTIQPALEGSKMFILVQSPKALAPRSDGQPNWVVREIR